MFKTCLVVLCMAVWACVSHSPLADAKSLPPVPPEFQKFFRHYVEDNRSLIDKALNAIGFAGLETGRGFALVVGVSSYPQLPFLNRELLPAKEDLINLEDYLKNVEFFEEIVVIEEDEVNLANLVYFLQNYFPDRFKEFPNSRFLFAYSGHGFNNELHGYLLKSTATNLNDKYASIELDELKVYIDDVVESGHQVLVLINACSSGSFLKKPFGSGQYTPKSPGAHAITAGGASEQVWHDPRIGPGSIFFEKLFVGLNDEADQFPKDGIINVNELATYLTTEIRNSTNQTQNPIFADISKNGSKGSFFFFNRHPQIEAGFIPEWPWKTRLASVAPDQQPTVDTTPPATPTGLTFSIR